VSRGRSAAVRHEGVGVSNGELDPDTIENAPIEIQQHRLDNVRSTSCDLPAIWGGGNKIAPPSLVRRRIPWTMPKVSLVKSSFSYDSTRKDVLVGVFLEDMSGGKRVLQMWLSEVVNPKWVKVEDFLSALGELDPGDRVALAQFIASKKSGQLYELMMSSLSCDQSVLFEASEGFLDKKFVVVLDDTQMAVAAVEKIQQDGNCVVLVGDEERVEVALWQLLPYEHPFLCYVDITNIT
jgi:hypothetical protein